MANTNDPRIKRGPYPEFTLSALLVGYALGILIALSMGYASLVLGFSIEGSELAAILGWGVLRGIMRRTSIVENNINQTITSGINPAGTGGVFTLPTRFMLDAKWRAGGHLPEAIASREEGTEAFVEAHKMVPNG